MWYRAFQPFDHPFSRIWISSLLLGIFGQDLFDLTHDLVSYFLNLLLLVFDQVLCRINLVSFDLPFQDLIFHLFDLFFELLVWYDLLGTFTNRIPYIINLILNLFYLDLFKLLHFLMLLLISLLTLLEIFHLLIKLPSQILM